MRTRHPLVVNALLTTLVALGAISTDLYLPSLPTLTEVFSASVGTVQLTLSVFVGGFAVAQLVYGPLSDRLGRRPVLLGGLVIYLAASTACGLAGSIEELIVARFFQSLGACSGIVLGRAVVRDLYGRERAAKVLSYMGTVMGLIPAVAPIVGGYITVEFGWRTNFFALTGFGVMALIGVAFILAESNKWKDPTATRPRQLAANYGTLLRDKAYLGYLMSQAFTFSALFSFISGASFVLIGDFGVARENFGYFFAIVVLGFMTGTVLSGRFTMRVGLNRMIGIGSVITLGAGGIMLTLGYMGVHEPLAVIGPAAIQFIGVGMVLPNSLAGAIGPYEKMAGTASALMGSLQYAIGATVGVLVGVFHDGNQLSMAWGIVICSAVALAGFHAFAERKPRAAPAAASVRDAG